jgi:SAM-dependent methyltransferase
VGLDFSATLIDGATRMRDAPRTVRFQVPTEGDCSVEVGAEHEPTVGETERSRCHFHVSDASALADDFSAGRLGEGRFDVAVVANLLCRLPEPLRCLDGLERVVAPGGVALLVTPFSWLEQFTHRSRWLGGYEDPVSGIAIESRDVLAAEMEKRGFRRVHEEQMPLIIREHQRKYQYIVSEATGWQREG